MFTGMKPPCTRYFNTDFVILTNGLPTKLGVMNGAEWIFEKAVVSILGFSAG